MDEWHKLFLEIQKNIRKIRLFVPFVIAPRIPSGMKIFGSAKSVW